jgi:hypothetical protein
MSLAADSIFLPPPADSDADVRCLRCEYRLRGLARDGKCPECGAAIEPSWQRHEFLLAHGWTPLAMASPKWLRAIGWSAALFAGGGVGLVVGNDIMLAAGAASFSLPAAIMMLASVVTLTVATWLAGQPEPAGESSPRLRLTVRAASAYWPISLILPYLLARIVPGRSIEFWRHRNMVEAFVVAAITWIVWRRFAGMLRRHSRPRLARWAARLRWIWPAAMVVQAVFLTDFGVLQSVGFLIMPQPVVGETTPTALLPYSLVHWPRFTPALAGWAVLVLMTVATLGLLARIAVLLFRTAREIERS